MVSQTLEILRQGVWASLTGGWFFDPHQDVYCNTFHLYLWLLLLMLPFTIYLYCPPQEVVWYVYCLIVTVVFTVIKLVNLGLHRMYDTSECIQVDTSDTRPECDRRRGHPHDHLSKREEEGIELQEMSSRKEASESIPFGSFTDGGIAGGAGTGTDIDSVESADYNRSNDNYKSGSTIVDLKVDVHRKNSSESSEDASFLPAVQNAAASAGNIQLQEVTVVSQDHPNKPSTSINNNNNEGSGDASQAIAEEASSTKNRYGRGRNAISRKPRKLTRQSSIDSQDKHLDVMERRHSNVTNSSLHCLPATADLTNIKPTGSLELSCVGKNENFNNYWSGENHNIACIRRIHSTALETCCPPPTNLVPLPNSLEVIGQSGSGSQRNSALPPPSSTLVRNPHLSLCPYYSYGSEIVYPIAEQSDEHQTSHGPDTDMERNSESDYEDDQSKFGRYTILVRLNTLNDTATDKREKYRPK